MARLSFNKRSTVNLALLTCSVLCGYILLHIMVLALSSVTGGGSTGYPLSDMPVAIKSISETEGGKLDLTLTINIKDLMHHLHGFKLANGEATSNPVPQVVDFVNTAPGLCSKTKNLETLIYVHTSPSNEGRRQNVRSTWGHSDIFADGRMKVVFMTGIPENSRDQEVIDQESRMYGDIVQGNFVDNYKNLTLKAIMGLRWVAEYCREAKFVMKADDDAFINIFEMQTIIDKNRDRPKLVTCPLWKENSMPILRDPAKCMKWCVKYTEFPGMSYFPKYCAGLAYMFTNDIVPELYNASRTTPFFWIDDVYVTGVLLAKVKSVAYVDIMKQFTLKKDIGKEEYLNSGSKKPTKILLHIKDDDLWHAMWQSVLKRLSEDEIKQLGPTFLSNYPEMKHKWANSSIINRH